MKKILLFILFPFILFGQSQIGSDIDGETADDQSGSSVSLNNDGTILAIGAARNDDNGANSGHVRVFKNVSGVWTQLGADINREAAEDGSGSSVSLSSDGSVVAIGALGNDANGNYTGHVRVYQNISGTWTQIGADVLEEIRIGSQVWSLRNLDVGHFRNGDPITEAKTAEEWSDAFARGMPAWCYYQNDPDYGARFLKPQEESVPTGKLYNWFAVDDPRGLAPVGWHVPSQEEWDKLTVYLGGMRVAGGKMMVSIGGNTASGSQSSRRALRGRRSRAGSAPAQASGSAHGGTNSSGFTALPGGSRGYNGSFTGYGAFGYWWSSTEFAQWPLEHTYMVWYRYLTFFESLKTDLDFLTSPTMPAGNGLSVRLVKN